MSCLPGGHRARALSSGGQRAARSRQAPALRRRSGRVSPQPRSGAQRNAQPGAQACGGRGGRPGRKELSAGGRAGLRGGGGRGSSGCRLLQQGRECGRPRSLSFMPRPQPQPHSAPAPAPLRSVLLRALRSMLLAPPRCAPLGAETSAHPQVSSGRWSPASPALRRGDRRLRGDDKLSSGRGRAWGTSLGPWGCWSSGGGGGTLGSDSRTPLPLPGQLPA